MKYRGTSSPETWLQRLLKTACEFNINHLHYNPTEGFTVLKISDSDFKTSDDPEPLTMRRNATHARGNFRYFVVVVFPHSRCTGSGILIKHKKAS